MNINKIRDKFKEWGQDLQRVPLLGKLIVKSQTVVLPGFQHIPLYNVMDYFFQSLGKGILFQRAAALTYRIFIALIPMIIALFSIIAYLGDNVQHTLLTLFQSIVPVYAWPAVGDVITQVITQQNGTLSSLMLVFGVYFAMLCCNGLLAALNISYFNEQKRSFLKQLLLSFVIMMTAFFIIVIVLGLLIFSSVLLNHIQSHIAAPSEIYFYLIHGVKWILIFAALYFLVSILYYLAPVNKKNYRFFSAGSSICTILMVLILWILNVYFSNFTNYNLIYGSLGALFAILLWINWSSLVLLIGFDLNVSIAKAKEENIIEDIEK
ncbi:MAG: YihY/virulence factor BrkB family protein [Bacteroidales bacterium]|nr:YihY/virulence factor BrkB family protein [Bacteroidales bacterium]